MLGRKSACALKIFKKCHTKMCGSKIEECFMKKNKMTFVAFSICACALLSLTVGCTTTQGLQTQTEEEKPQKTAIPQKTRHVERELIDWKGAAIGQDVPQWVAYAVDSDYESLSKLKNLEGKRVFLAENRGKNLNVLKSWTNNFDVQGGFSRALQNQVVAAFGGALEGSINDSEDASYLNELVGSFSKAKITGLVKQQDYWVQTRIIDNDAKTTDDVYQYFVIYSMEESDYRNQIDKVLGVSDPKTEKQEQLRADARDVMLGATILSLTEDEEE